MYLTFLYFIFLSILFLSLSVYTKYKKTINIICEKERNSRLCNKEIFKHIGRDLYLKYNNNILINFFKIILNILDSASGFVEGLINTPNINNELAILPHKNDTYTTHQKNIKNQSIDKRKLCNKNDNSMNDINKKKIIGQSIINKKINKSFTPESLNSTLDKEILFDGSLVVFNERKYEEDYENAESTSFIENYITGKNIKIKKDDFNNVENNISDLPIENNMSDLPIENNISDLPIENNISYTSIENNISNTLVENNISDTFIENNMSNTLIENNMSDTLIENNMSNTPPTENNKEPKKFLAKKKNVFKIKKKECF
jgi:hypothetical protein